MTVTIKEYEEMFNSDPEKDMKKGIVREKNGIKWVITTLVVCVGASNKGGAVELEKYRPTDMKENARAKWANDNACEFCKGSAFHTCTIYDCRPAVNMAEKYYDKWIRRRDMEKEQAIEILQKHIDTYKHQLTDTGWYEMVRMGIARPTVQERLLYSADAKEQIQAYEMAIEALKK